MINSFKVLNGSIIIKVCDNAPVISITLFSDPWKKLYVNELARYVGA